MPLLYVLAPDGEVRATWAGSASAEQLEGFLAKGERAVAGRLPAGGPEAAMRRGDGLLARGRADEAARAYAEAARRGGPGWGGRAVAVDAEMSALQLGGRNRDCAALAARATPGLPRARQRVTVPLTGLMCAVAGGKEAWARRARSALEPLARSALREPSAMLDDRGMLYQAIIQTRKLAGDEAGARSAAADWLDSVEADDRLRPDPPPDERAARDACRLYARCLAAVSGP